MPGKSIMDRPNILLISIDTLRADHLSCYGYYRKTSPNIDRIASEGTTFFRHYSTGVWTPPGHASMLTGLYVSEHGVHGENRLSEKIPTIASVLRENGYQTAGFVNNSQVGELVGLAKGHDFFVEVWKGFRASSLMGRITRGGIRRIRKIFAHEDMGASRTNRLFKIWLETEKEAGKPFYAFLHYIEPHNPLNPPCRFKKNFRTLESGSIDKRKVKKIAHNPLSCFVDDLRPTEAEIAFLKALYDGEIAYTDHKIGEIAEILEKNGLYDNTMIIITSDHGEHFGEHGFWSHVASLHEEVLRIPLVIKYPNGPECAKEVEGYTQLIDIFPTVMDIAGVNANISTSGLSLSYDKKRSYHEHIFAEWEGRVPFYIKRRLRENGAKTDLRMFKTKMSMVQGPRYKYVLKEDGEENLFDISSGSEKRCELANLSREVRRMRGLLEEYGSPRTRYTGKTRSMDDEIKSNLESLGYI